jgi:membrane protein
LKLNHASDSESSIPVEVPDTGSRSLKRLLKSTFNNWTEDNGPRLAAALAYYALFSLAPLLMIAMAVAGATLGRQSAASALEGRFYGLLGTTGAQVIQGILQDAHRPGITTITGIAGSFFLLIGASALFVELQEAFDTIWHVEPVSIGLWEIVVERFLSFILVVITEILLMISVLLTTAESVLGRLLPGDWLSFRASVRVAGIAVSLGVTTLLFGMMFKFLPKVRVEWRDVWPAAIVTAIMFDLGKLLIALFLRKNNIISAYGAADSLVVLVGWVYYSAMILYFGAELAKVHARVYGVQTTREIAPH